MTTVADIVAEIAHRLSSVELCLIAEEGVAVVFISDGHTGDFIAEYKISPDDVSEELIAVADITTLDGALHSERTFRVALHGLKTLPDPNKIMEQGGFNTGRLYTSVGQQIFWTVYADGWVCLRDRSRMTECWWQEPAEAIANGFTPSPRYMMAIYDSPMLNGSSGEPRWFHYGPDERRHDENNRAPADFDYGPYLNI